MKRHLVLTLAILLTVLCCNVIYAEVQESAINPGDSFLFGSYEQDNDLENGEEPIEWIVLAREGNDVLLHSKYSLDNQSYHVPGGSIVWKDASLRAWLNQEFYQSAFSSSEQSAIVRIDLLNTSDEGNSEWQTMSGDNTQDDIFLLSYLDANYFYGSNDARKNRGTEYAREQGARVWPYEETDWWLRSPGKVQQEAAFVGSNGDYYSTSAANKKGVRPALLLDLTVSRSDFHATLYAAAQSLFDDGSFEEAIAAFEALGSYANSASKIPEIRYSQAMAAVNSREYDFAISIFEDLGDYLDSISQTRECRYLQAVDIQESGDVEQAIKLFSKLGQYKDSMDRLIKCFAIQGISIYYASGTAVNTGTDTGYSKADKIGVKDAHFGWRLGRFMMSDFTRVSDDSKGNPIFIKTLGDKVTLWFDLEQDIARLNGSDNLSIASDNNGSDEYFGVTKTNFGLGALIVRHKDYQNNLSDPVIYTDFLAAKESYGANTKVELFEEGDYEVTLNYETVSKSLGVVSNFANYRIRFDFSVRNGNVMVFPFDVLTGAELSNNSMTENGFYLDLAKSRYLDIIIKRSVLTEGAGGITEDQRFNRPAKDGDRYTQEGIYTIAVYNRYINESTEKQIFVGSDELYKEYAAKGFILDKKGQ